MSLPVRKQHYQKALDAHKKHRPLVAFLVFLITFLLVSCSASSVRGTKTTPTPPILSIRFLSHFTGGFSIDTVDRVINAAADGIQVDLKYGSPYSSADAVGQALVANNMKEIEGQLWTYLYYYECHKLNTCNATLYPELNSMSALLTDVTTHLQQVQNNSQIVGYWILDDWPGNDAGGAKIILQKINALIHQYTPGKPSICGFGGELRPITDSQISWNDGTAANFSPQGCDMVGLYNYASSNTTGTYDWSMPGLLAAEFKSLQERGWNITQEPLIGIPQAFGGNIDGEPWPVPPASGIETETNTLCQKGATGIIYYAWDNSGLDSTSQLPWNNTEIAQGIRNGIADCKGMWK